MPNVPAPAVLSEVALVTETSASYPALRRQPLRPLDPRVDRARLELWRAFQRGALSEQELARTLERLEFDPLAPGLLLEPPP
jgi:hypothetical protein